MKSSDSPIALSPANHLYKNEHQRAVSTLEAGMFAIFESINRWQGKCVEACGSTISGHENTLLNVIRLNDRPKGLSDLAQFLNRSDLSNIQYSIRKLQKLELIQKSPGKSKNQRKDVTYEVTEEGRKLTDKFSAARELLLYNAFLNAGFDEEKVNELRGQINTMAGIYETVSREVSLVAID